MAAVPNDTVDKRVFLAALDCVTRGWFARRAPAEPLTPGLEWRFHCGNEVGAAARAQLGHGLMLPRSPVSRAVEATQRYLANDAVPVLFEATFQVGSLIARADALRRSGDGWTLIEVKSSKEPANGKIDPGLIDDIGFTTMVAQAAGLAIDRCVLMLLSRDYRLGCSDPILAEVDVTATAIGRAEELAASAADVIAAIGAADAPEGTLDLVCRKCEYFASRCLGQGVAASIFVLPGLSQKKLDAMKPIVDVRMLPETVDLTDNQRRVFEVIRSGIPAVTGELGRLDEVVAPVYYLDFETVSPSLPWFEGDGAYTQHPFQYSIHRCEQLGSEPAHREYLAPTRGDWRRILAEQLLHDLGTEGSIVVYTDFEFKVLQALALGFPDLAGRFEAVMARLFDLHDVIKRGYCHPGFQGRTSIKKVLPVMVPDLSYADLSVGEGESASGAFGLIRVGRYGEETHEQWRRDLLEYCKLDTLAMVEVHRALVAVWQRAKGG